MPRPQILKCYVLVGTLSPQYIFCFLMIRTFLNTTHESPALSIHFGYIARLPIFNLHFVKHILSWSKENGTLANNLTQMSAPINNTKILGRSLTSQMHHLHAQLKDYRSKPTELEEHSQLPKQTNTARGTLPRHCGTKFQLPSTSKYIPYPFYFFFTFSHGRINYYYSRTILKFFLIFLNIINIYFFFKYHYYIFICFKFFENWWLKKIYD